MSQSDTSSVVDFLKTQHVAIKELFAETLAATDAQTQREAFLRLRTLLAVHETAEEMLVHPRARRKLGNGPDIVAARLAEEHDAKVALRELEQLQPGSPEFSAALTDLQSAVLAHAEHEEAEEFATMEQQLDADELAKLGRAVQVVERLAPTHPHPGVESALANMAAGPLAAVVDRTRDALQHALR
jgi:hemerythrin superfamily protein